MLLTPLGIDPNTGDLYPATVNGNPWNLPDGSTIGSSALVAASGGLSQFPGGSYAFRDIGAITDEETDSRIEDLTAGDGAQKLFSTRTDPTTYERSDTWFAHEQDFTGLSVYNSTAAFSASLISPRHIVMAYHAALPNATTLYFASATGVVSTRTISSQTRVGSTDIAIGYLSADVPSGINFFKVLHSKNTDASIISASLIGHPLIYTDRNYKAYVAQSTSGASFEAPDDSHRLTFYSLPAGGDSSSPIGVIIDGQFALIGMMHTNQGTGDALYAYYDQINAKMLELGGSYQLTPLEITALPANFPTPISVSGTLSVIGAGSSSIVLGAGDGAEGIAVSNTAGASVFVVDPETGATQITGAVGFPALTITTAIQTASKPVLDLAQTWNNGATTFSFLKGNVTNTASATGSLLMDLQVGAVSKFSVRKDGRVVASGGGVFSGDGFFGAGLEVSGDVALNAGLTFPNAGGDSFVYLNGAAALVELVSAASQSIRRNSGNTDFELFTPIANGGAGGTPSSLTLTNATGLPTAGLLNDAVTYAKIQNVSATDKLLGRSTSGSGDVEEIACTAAGRALLDDADNAAQRTTLGGTTVGQNIFTLTNPSAARYLRINSDNTISILTIAQTRDDLGMDGSASYAADVFEVTDAAYDATAWNGSNEVPTKNAVRDKFESLTAAAWGSISGTLSAQTDLQAALDLKAGLVGNTFTGAQINSYSGTASTPALKLSGVPFAGTGTTSFPLLYINDANATPSTTLKTAGTYFGVNGDGSQDLMNLMKDGASVFKISSNGVIDNDFSSVSFGGYMIAGFGWLMNDGTLKFTSGSAGFSSTSRIAWSSGANPLTGVDTGLNRNAAGVVEVNNGTAGTYRELLVRSAITAPGTLASFGAAGTKGRRAFITDGSTTLILGLGLTAVGGGANNVPIYDDGTNWIVG